MDTNSSSHASTQPSVQLLEEEEGIYLNMSSIQKAMTYLASSKGRHVLSKNQRMQGHYLSRARGRGMIFSEVRAYQPGDDIRTIDWRVTARTDKTHTKIFDEEREHPVVIIVDQSPSLFFGSKNCFKSHMAGLIGALTGWLIVKGHDRLGGVIFNHERSWELLPRHSQSSWARWCHQLIEASHDLTIDSLNQNQVQQKEYKITQTFRRMAQWIKPGTEIIMISDWYHESPAIEIELQRLAHRYACTWISVFDPMESHLPALLGHYTDGENQFIADGRHTKTQQDFEKAFIEKQQRWQTLAKKFGVRWFEVDTDLSVADTAAFCRSLLHNQGLHDSRFNRR